jgi:hypothetical protein
VPVLRMPQDDSIGNVLGNLGTTLSTALNPMNQLRAQDIQQQIQQRNFEVNKARALDAANANAATVYGNANPHNLSPADLEVAKAQIRNGTYNASQTIDALKAAGTYASAQAAAGLIDANYPQWSEAERASAKSDILSGRKNLSEILTDRANAGINTNKANATIDATGAARDATTGPNAALAAEAAASGDAPAAGKLIAQGNEMTAPVISGPLTSPSVQTQIDQRRTQQAIAGTTPPAGQPVSAGLVPAQTAADVAKKTIEAQAAPRSPDQVVPTVAPTDVTTGQPVNVAPGAPPPPGVVSQQGSGPDTAAITASATAKTAADTGTKFRADDLTSDMESGRKANDMLRTVALMRMLAGEIDNDTPVGQLASGIANRIKDQFGITLNPSQSARNAFEQIGNQLISETRKDDGVLRVAGPELSFFGKTLPNARQDKASLGLALDQLETKARNLIDIGRLARTTYGKTNGAPDAAAYSDYSDRRDAILRPPTADQPAGTPATSPRMGSQPAPASPQRKWVVQPDGSMRLQ